MTRLLLSGSEALKMHLFITVKLYILQSKMRKRFVKFITYVFLTMIMILKIFFYIVISCPTVCIALC